ncbi:MAG: iron ABC transporter substrate-binding protein [Myxococcales bacterium]|nr:iron ABC transporter substrate-binding protein [Myxococcales bacterium]|tara:strand:+ start:585 stop:1652 length:1068 start_codon:yes stop_codon:yes gene_type:complete
MTRILTALLLLLAALSGCQGESPQTPATPSVKTDVQKPQTTTTEKTKAKLVVYSGRSAKLVEPLLSLFEAKTGIKVRVRFDKSTQTLANRIASEGQVGEADVFFAQDSGYLGALAKAGHLQALPKAVLDRVPENYRDKDGKWVATSGRARVLVYSPERVKVEDLPSGLEALADPKWTGRIGWAPSNSSYQAHVSGLRALWGEEKTKNWLAKMRAVEPKVYPKNSPQVKAVSSGEIDIGWVNHYYLHRLKAANPSLKAANYSFRDQSDAGNLLMLSGVAVTAHAKNVRSARALAQFLVSDEAQNYFAQTVYEYPTVSGIKTHKNVPPKSGGWAAVEQSALSDVVGTVKLLRQLGLQ